MKDIHAHEKQLRLEDVATHDVEPFLSFTRITALVFLRAFFFPSNVSAERHVLHRGISAGAVRHSMWGKLLDVPVPRKISSMSSAIIPLLRTSICEVSDSIGVIIVPVEGN